MMRHGPHLRAMAMTLPFDSTPIVGMQPEEPSEASGARCMRDDGIGSGT